MPPKQLTDNQLAALARGRQTAALKRAEMEAAKKAAAPSPAVNPSPTTHSLSLHQPQEAELRQPDPPPPEPQPQPEQQPSDTDSETDEEPEAPISKAAPKPARPPKHIVDYYRSKANFYDTQSELARAQAAKSIAKQENPVSHERAEVEVAKSVLHDHARSHYRKMAHASLFPGVPYQN